MAVSERSSMEVTDAERRAIEAMRTAADIVGDGELVPYDVIGLAREVTRLRDELGDAVDQARLFNRGGVSWLDYDRLLARWERIANAQ